MPSKGIPIMVLVNLPITYLPPSAEVCTLVAFAFTGGALGSIHCDTSPSHVPLVFAIHLCMSPGVMKSCQAFIIAAESGMAAGVVSVFVSVAAVVAEESVLAASVFSLLLLQAKRNIDAEQTNNVIF